MVSGLCWSFEESIIWIVMLWITAEISIPMSEFELSYARSSGPGGQNVNKVNSKAVLRWNIDSSPSLSEEIRRRLLTRLGHRITQEGEIVIASDSYRDQLRNREDCFEKLQKLISLAALKPKPRKKTRPSRSSKKRVRETKSRNSDKKSLRKRPRRDE